VLACGFTENCQFGAKIDRNSVFLGHDLRIANQLSIMSRISIFTGFENFHIFARNPWVLAYVFTENCQFAAKTDQNSVFLGHEPSYSESVIYNAPVFQFLRVLKNFTFCSKSKGVSLRFYRKLPVWGQKLIETPHFLVVTPVLRICYL
jgi:hypothetical protein